jgi:hypothetical protein
MHRMTLESQPSDDSTAPLDYLCKPAAAVRRAMLFDVDASAVASLLEVLPGWRMDTLFGATVQSLPCGWDPSGVELLILGARENFSETVALCRFLSFATDYSADFRRLAPHGGPLPGFFGHPNAPLLVLVSEGRGCDAGALIEAGAHGVLSLPIRADEVAKTLGGLWASPQPTSLRLGNRTSGATPRHGGFTRCESPDNG